MSILDQAIGGHCGCCGDAAGGWAAAGEGGNPPGQPQLHYRVGRHSSFKAGQLQALSRQPALQGLTSRDGADPAIALLDGWAALLDVLSFYQERIINEGFLRTASERRSLLELGRQIGYELRPGVAASTYLAFTLETAPGAPAITRIDAGLKTQSVPAQDEQPQVFETLAAITARAAWNELRVVSEEPALPYWGGRTLYVRGQHSGLKPGDALLIVGDERMKNPGSENWDFRQVARLQVVPPAEPSADPLAGVTIITLNQGVGSVIPHVEPARVNPRLYALRARATLFGAAAPDWRAMPRSLRASYLGFDDDSRAPISLYRQWPGFTLADISDPPTVKASGSGLLGEYFEGRNFGQRQFTRTDPQIDFRWGAGAPAGLSSDTFSVRWRGWLQIPASGSYTFYLRGDDGVRLWVDGRLLIDEWQDQGPTEFSATLSSLEANSKVDIWLEYYENSGDSTVELRWSGPGISKSLIPAERLYPRDVHSVHLDASYPRWVAGSWVVMAIPEYQELYQLLDNREDGRAAFTLSSKTSRLQLRGEQLRELFNERLRDTAVYGESELLQWAPRPLSALVAGDQLLLDSWQPELSAGQWLALSGLVLAPARLALSTSNEARVQARLLAGVALAAIEIERDQQRARFTFADGEQWFGALELRMEVVQIRIQQRDGERSRLHLQQPLRHSYLPLSLRINANVAEASHGDSKQMAIQAEILGSGDAARSYQRFRLRQAPLTHIAAATPSGSQSSLELRVDGLLWQPVAQLTAMAADSRGYLLRQQDDGSTLVQFGDGQFGSRLPTGQMNVTARYRVGIGRGGNVAAGQISLLLSRPPGLKAVTNPLPASGGADAESGERARRNAPLTVRALERIVSLADFEDFAAAFAGIGKAQAVWLWNGEGRLVHVTVVGVEGETIDPAGALYRHLREAMDAVRPPHQPLQLAPGSVLRFGLSAHVRVAADRRGEEVIAAVKQALAGAFGFDQRRYGQSLSGSEVVAVIQAVAGVTLVDLDLLRLKRGNSQQLVTGPDGRLEARQAHWHNGAVVAAELLLVDEQDLQITELSP